MKENEVKHLKTACREIENICRSLGKDCQVIFTTKGVSIAPPSWSGDCWGETFYDALVQSVEYPVE